MGIVKWVSWTQTLNPPQGDDNNNCSWRCIIHIVTWLMLFHYATLGLKPMCFCFLTFCRLFRLLGNQKIWIQDGLGFERRTNVPPNSVDLKNIKCCSSVGLLIYHNPHDIILICIIFETCQSQNQNGQISPGPSPTVGSNCHRGAG